MKTTLKKIRLKRGWTQHDLSVAAGIPATVISNFECGVRSPALRNLRKLREALGCTWDELLGK